MVNGGGGGSAVPGVDHAPTNFTPPEAGPCNKAQMGEIPGRKPELSGIDVVSEIRRMPDIGAPGPCLMDKSELQHD